MKILMGIVIIIILEIGFAIFICISGDRRKKLDIQILQNRLLNKSQVTNEKVLLVCVSDKAKVNVKRDEYCWVCIFNNRNEIHLIKNNQLFASYFDKSTFFEDWRFVADDIF